MPSPSPTRRGDFLLVACQGGAEASVRARQGEILPALAPGAWRRGAVTFRLPQRGADGLAFDPPDDFFPDLIFGRAVIRSFGQVVGAGVAELTERLVTMVDHAAWDNVHVWPRDPREEHDSPAIRSALVAACGRTITSATPVARPGELILDCMVDSAERWWVGWHRAATPPSLWPGGMYPVDLPADKASRAWLKLDEAIATFGIDLSPGGRAVELGAAPGGACQRLLEAGLHVTGIDPAMIDPGVAGHPHFEHWRMRARDVRLKNLRGFDWVVADMNIDPSSTLEALERVMAAPGRRPRGIIATLKLPQWARAAEIPGWLARFRSWGYEPRARQLSTAGREVCVVALSAPVRRRPRRATRRPGRSGSPTSGATGRRPSR
jgi:23S rRNA (cytidine2498-2'-O)-methyltransferase